MPNPTTNFKDSFGTDLGNKLITKEYLMTVYPQIAANMITPELWVWGTNSSLQLGVNDTNTRSTPVTTSAGGANWKQVSVSQFSATAIKTDGTLWTWGLGSQGQVGDNTAINRSTPVTTFAGGTNWKQVNSGERHSLAIKTDGTLWTWGRNVEGQLGINNTTSPICTPVTTFAGGNNWKQVAGGSSYTAAIKTDGTLWTWGSNVDARLGINVNDATNRLTPVTTFLGGTNWKQVSGGGRFTAAIKTDGTLWTWGYNLAGSLGINNLTSPICTPVQVFGNATNWKQVACGDDNAVAIKTDGTLWTWGNGTSGQLGNNETNVKCTPVTTFAGGTNWKQASCFTHIAAIKTDGTLWVWGTNVTGRLGTNDATNRLTPVTTFAGGTNWKQVSFGINWSAAIKTSNDL